MPWNLRMMNSRLSSHKRRLRGKKINILSKRWQYKWSVDYEQQMACWHSKTMGDSCFTKSPFHAPVECNGCRSKAAGSPLRSLSHPHLKMMWNYKRPLREMEHSQCAWMNDYYDKNTPLGIIHVQGCNNSFSSCTIGW